MYYYTGHMFGGFWFMWIFLLIIIAGIVFVVLYLTKNVNNTKQEDSPLKIAKERYAKGEITEKQYQKFKEMLK